jgi:uncharacterized membrane protein
MKSVDFPDSRFGKPFGVSPRYNFFMLKWDGNSSHWKLVFFYCNPKDKRLFVPKRHGLMAALNFANPIAWIITGILLGIPALGAVWDVSRVLLFR